MMDLFFFVCVQVLMWMPKNNGGGTALHYAASKWWLEIAQLYFKSDERVPTELKKAIMQARGEKKLTQSQLAQVLFLSSSSILFPYCNVFGFMMVVT